MELWEKVRRFLIFWLLVLAGLVIASLVVHGSSIASALAVGFKSGLSSLVSLGLTAAIVVLIIRSILL